MPRSVSRFALLLFLAGSAVYTDPVPKATVRGRVEGPVGQSMPWEIRVRVRPSLELMGNEKLSWETEVACPLHNGEWSCEVPAGRVDLRISGTAVSPVYRWGLVLPAGKTEDFGTLKLQRGATLSGWIRLEGEVLTHSVLISLLPQWENAPILNWDADTLQTVRLEAGSRPWGFFRFDGLKPRSYAIVAEQVGLPPVRLGPIKIEGEKPVELPSPLQLTKPLEVQGDIWQNPGPSQHKTWQVQLTPLPSPIPNEPFQELRRLVRDRDYDKELGRGSWSFAGLAAGDYEMSVTRLGEPGVWRTEKIHVEPKKTTFDFEIPMGYVRGRVSYQGEPVAGAEVWFRSEKSSVRLISDEAGVISGEVPAAEEGWKVTVVARTQGLEVALQAPVRSPRNEGLFTEIVLPDTRLPILVVNEQGRPVEGATVIVEGDPPSRMTTDEQGICLFRALKPGPRKVKATGDPGRESETREVLLKERVINPPLVRLLLPTRIEFLGRVAPRFGTALGAEVYASPQRKPGESLQGFSTRTVEDGRFRLGIPPGTRKLNLLVMAFGQALRRTRVDVDSRRRVNVPVDTPGGTLVLELPEETLKAITRPADENQGVTTLPYLLRHWAELQGVTWTPGLLVVPNVEPGTYSLCAGEPPEVRWGGAPAGGRACVSGVLEAGGELRLALPGTTPAAPTRMASPP
jgi:hypothetical protein